MSQSPVLVYSQLTIGHRQIYCNVLAGYFLDRGCPVTVAVGVESADAPRPPFIEALRQNPRVQIVYLHQQEDLGSPEREMATIRRLQDEHAVGLTFFIDADLVRKSLLSLARSGDRPDFRGAIKQLFLHHESVAPFLRPGSTLPAHVAIRRRLRGLWEDYRFFHHYLPSLGVPVLSYSLDPRFVRLMRRDDLRFLPDIYTHFGNNPEAFAQDEALARLQTFLAAQHEAGREIVLYFGTNQRRRGYEWLLRLTRDHPDLAFVHCGKRSMEKGMPPEAIVHRETLAAQGRIFETAGFITDERITDTAFQACHYVLMPYVCHYGSSGVMIQAASYGKPTLVPDDGLMAYWMRHFNCGLTFNAGSYASFEAGFQHIRREYPQYQAGTRPFVEQFSKQNLYRALDGVRRPPLMTGRQIRANA